MSTACTYRYHLPSANGEGWAIVFLDSTGCFSVLSDWGNYGHRWPYQGWGPGDFRAFFLQCEDDYVLRKIAPSKEYNGGASCESIKSHILERRRSLAWTRQRARDEWRLLVDICESVDNIADLTRWYDQTTINDAGELTVYSSSRQAKMFIANVLPRLRDVIRAELAKEAA